MQKIKLYSIFLAGFGSASVIALLWLINSAAPDRAGNIMLFYALAAILMFCLATLAGFYIRRLFGQYEFSNRYYLQASRQGIWFSLLLTVSLFLLSNNLFSWMNAGFLVLTLVFLESYLITKKQQND